MLLCRKWYWSCFPHCQCMAMQVFCYVLFLNFLADKFTVGCASRDLCTGCLHVAQVFQCCQGSCRLHGNASLRACMSNPTLHFYHFDIASRLASHHRLSPGFMCVLQVFPPVKWYFVLVIELVAPAFAVCNAYGAGLTDWNVASTYAKLCIFVFAAWAGNNVSPMSPPCSDTPLPLPCTVTK